MPAPLQTYTQPNEFTLVNLNPDPSAPASNVVNGVTINASYKPLPNVANRWSVAVSTVGRAPELTFNLNATVPTGEAALALAKAQVDIVYDLASALPPLA